MSKPEQPDAWAIGKIWRPKQMGYSLHDDDSDCDVPHDEWHGCHVMCDIGLCARIEYLLHLRLV